MNGPSTLPTPGDGALPPGLRVAGVGVRVGAWLIDSLILGAFQIGFWMFAAATGVLTVDPEAERQMETAPLTLPTVTPYRVNLPLLAVMLAAFVVLNVAYAAVCWARFRAMPGQKALSLQVGSAVSGRNLSLGQALVRAVVAIGIPVGAFAGILYAVFAYETTVPWSDVLNPQPGGPADAWLSRWSGVLLLALLGAVVWPVLLFIWTATSPRRQGPHDRVCGSLVVGKDAEIRAAYGAPPLEWMAGSPPLALPPGASPGMSPGSAAAADSALGSSDESATEESEPQLPVWDPDSPSPTPVPGRGIWPGHAGWVDPRGVEPGEAGGADGGAVWLRTGDDSEAQPKLHSATVGRRVAAYLFDCVLVYMLYTLTATLIITALLPTADTTTIDERTYIFLGLAGGFEQLVYFTSGWALGQGTLGQRLLHMRVADATTGRSLTWMDSVVRWAVLQGPFALVTIAPGAIRAVVLAVAASWSLYLLYTTLVDPNQNGLHDRFLNSQVGLDV